MRGHGRLVALIPYPAQASLDLPPTPLPILRPPARVVGINSRRPNRVCHNQCIAFRLSASEIKESTL